MLDRHELEMTGLIGTKTAAIYDNNFNKLYRSIPWAEWFDTVDPLACRDEYLQQYSAYLSAMKLNQIHGLDAFSVRHLINGTTQTFDEAYHRHAGKRLRIYRGEYAYHKRINPDFVFIEDADIQPGDYVIVSIPHCTTGDIPIGFDDLMDRCTRLSVPVVIDCAYIGCSIGVSFRVDYPCVESVSFSLTKGTGLGHTRSGIRFSNINDHYPISQQNAYNHTVLCAAKIGIYFMQQLVSPDYIPNLYREHQLSVCRDAGLRPTPCVHLALGDESWESYNVDGYNRVGIRNLVKARRQGKI